MTDPDLLSTGPFRTFHTERSEGKPARDGALFRWNANRSMLIEHWNANCPNRFHNDTFGIVVLASICCSIYSHAERCVSYRQVAPVNVCMLLSLIQNWKGVKAGTWSHHSSFIGVKLTSSSKSLWCILWHLSSIVQSSMAGKEAPERTWGDGRGTWPAVIAIEWIHMNPSESNILAITCYNINLYVQ